MSLVYNYFRNFFHPTSNQDRKRRINEVTEGAQLPKYRRVSSIFPKQYNQPIEGADDINDFERVRQKRQNYNELLENFLMDQQSQQKKHYWRINDEEFSDEENLNAMRVPSSSTNRALPQSSSSGFQFNSTKYTSFGRKPLHLAPGKKISDRSDAPMKTVQPHSRNVPELVPIKQPQQNLNAYSMNENGNNQILEFKEKGRIRSKENIYSKNQDRHHYDFTARNRAFNNVSNTSKSVLERNYNLETKIKYDHLLKSLIPRFAQKASFKYLSDMPTELNTVNIPTVDLSSDETETNGATAPCRSNSFSQCRRKSSFEFKKPLLCDNLSDEDDDSDPFQDPVMSSTLILKRKSEKYGSEASHRKSESIESSPSIAPINSLREKQQSRNCLHENAITSIIQKYQEHKKKNDLQIQVAKFRVAKLSNETSEQEKNQQRKIDEAVTSLKQCIIIDEEDEVIDEFPPLTEQQLQIVRFGLQGPRGEIIVSKFSQNISRLDLNTLDGLNWLNDEVINFYMELIKLRSEEVDHLPKVHVMNTFFLGKLMQMGYSGVRRWTRKVDIFSYDIIPVPVHVGGVHWCMSIIHMREKSIKYYDSMGHPNMAVIGALNSYLQEESLDKRKTPFNTSDWTIECVRDCPQQRNGSDCGVFSCMFAEFVCRGSKISFDQQHMPYFRRKMVYEIATGKLILGY